MHQNVAQIDCYKWRPCRTLSIRCLKELGSPVNKNDICLNWYNLIPGPGQVQFSPDQMGALVTANIHFISLMSRMQ